MIHIEFQDSGPEELILNYLQGWVVRINDDVDVKVIGTDTDEYGYRRLIGNKCDEEGNPIKPAVVLAFPAEDLKIDIY